MFLTENLPLHNQVLFDLQIHRLLLGNNMNLNSELEMVVLSKTAQETRSWLAMHRPHLAKGQKIRNIDFVPNIRKLILIHLAFSPNKETSSLSKY